MSKLNPFKTNKTTGLSLLGAATWLTAAAGIFSPAQANASYVHCDIDENGDYCVIDLMTDCLNRTACSVPFGGTHSVYSISKIGTIEANKDVGQAHDAVEKGALLPANNEVCSDLPITQVYYQSTLKPNARWLTESDGTLGGYTDAIADKDLAKVAPKYPFTPDQKLSSKCVRLKAGPSEPTYTILSVRVAMNLDINRVGTLQDLMINAGQQLVLDLNKNKEISETYRKEFDERKSDGTPKNPELVKIVPVIDNYLQSIKDAIKEFDGLKVLWIDSKKPRKPVTNPVITERMRTAYAYSKYLISFLQRSSTAVPGYIVHLSDFVAEINQGFGFNDWDVAEMSGRPPKESSSAVSLVKIRETLPAVQKQSADIASIQTPMRFKSDIATYANQLKTLVTALDKMPVDPVKSGLYVVTDEVSYAAQNAYYACRYLTNLLPHGQDGVPNRIWGPYLAVVNPFCEAISSTFNLGATDDSLEGARALLDQGLKGRDSQRKLAPLFDVLALALADTTGSELGLVWDAHYQAASDMKDLVTTGLLPLAQKQGDPAVIEKIQPLLDLWQSQDFQALLQDIVTRSNNDPSEKTREITTRIRRNFTEARAQILSAFPDNATLTSGLPIPAGFDGSK